MAVGVVTVAVAVVAPAVVAADWEAARYATRVFSLEVYYFWYICIGVMYT